MKKQIALIGVTGFGQNHLTNLLKLAGEKQIDIAAAVIINPENPQAAEAITALQEYNTRIYSTSEEFFAVEKGKIDLVCLPTGIDSHAALCCAALDAGMNVLVEKPAAGSEPAVKKMIEAEKRSGKFVAVAFQHTYAPEINFLKRLIHSRRIGEIISSSAYVCWPRDDVYYSRNAWAARRTYRGMQVLDSPVNNACAHYLNLLLYLNGNNVEISAAASSVSGKVMRARPEIEMFDACDATYTLGNGKSIRIMMAHCCKTRINPKLKIVCENGIIRWSNTGWSVIGADNAVIAAGTPVHPGEMMFRTVIAKLSDPKVAVYTLQNAIEHTRCVEMLDRSCPIESVAAVKENGVYCVPGLEEKFTTEFGE